MTKKIAACVLLVDPHTNQIRVTNRRNSALLGLPGGKADPGETPMDAAIRELYEETGIVLQSSHPLFVGIDGDYTVHTFLAFDWQNTGECKGVEPDISSFMTTWEHFLANSDFVLYNQALKAAYDKFHVKIDK